MAEGVTCNIFKEGSTARGKVSAVSSEDGARRHCARAGEEVVGKQGEASGTKIKYLLTGEPSISAD
ncbi:hypothetical protein C0Q70_08760 [Pomacea canaliculata]|uniref:Uncharacterized protein n=1 Tax=Pomacea canaliculata TaxID=400727 RepID=A0A2T7P7X4_POMCA|nr:hypothetical protein C0Q70_08760 [Pomacea canaliculata]